MAAPARPVYSLFPSMTSLPDQVHISKDLEEIPPSRPATANRKLGVESGLTEAVHFPSPSTVSPSTESASTRLPSLDSPSTVDSTSIGFPSATPQSKIRSEELPIEPGENGDGSKEIISDAPSVQGRAKPAPSAIKLEEPPSVMRSMFPTYDAELPLNQQFYLPSQMSPSHLPYEMVCKSPYSPDFERRSGDVDHAGLLFKAIGTSNNDFTPELELPGMWRLATRNKGLGPAQSYRLQMRIENAPQPRRSLIPRKKTRPSDDPLFTFGPSSGCPFLSVSHQHLPRGPQKGSLPWSNVSIRKHDLSRFDALRSFQGAGVRLCDFKLKPAESDEEDWLNNNSKSHEESLVTTIIPQTAIRKSLARAAMSVPYGQVHDSDEPLDTTTDTLHTPGQEHTCRLRFTTLPHLRQQGYAIRHPSIGVMMLKVTGDVRIPNINGAAFLKGQTQSSTGRVELLAPIKQDYPPEYDGAMKSPGYKLPEIVLASIDLSSSTLFLDGAALSDVIEQEPYIVDTAISSLVAVLIAETVKPRLSRHMHFAPPPTQPLVYQGERGRRIMGRSKKPKKVGKVDKASGEMETALSTGFAALALILGVAVDGLGKLVDKAQEKEKGTTTLEHAA